ncbi:MAG: transglycosylase family protein [Acidimicrobiales bacterium]
MPRLATSTGTARSVGVVLAGLAAAVAGMGALASPASASRLHSAQARVAALTSLELRQASRVHTWTARYQADKAKANHLRAQVSASRTALGVARAQYQKTEELLRQEALLSYAGAAQAPSPAAVSAGGFVSESDQAAYERAAVGDLSGTLAQFQSERAAMATSLARYDQRLLRQRRATHTAADARGRALREAVVLQATLARARTRLAALAAQATGPGPGAGPPVGNGIRKAVLEQMAGTTGVSSGTGAGRPQKVASATPSKSGPSTTLRPATLRLPTAPHLRAAPRLPASSQAPTSSTTPPPTPAPSTTSTTNLPPAGSLPAAAAPGGQPPPAGGAWLQLRQCESGGNYQENTGNGFYGAYQFSQPTWSGLGYSGRADLAPYWIQDQAAQRLQAAYGWGSWPACSAALGL